MQLDEEIVFLNKYKITPNELYIARLILLAKDDEEQVCYLSDFLSISEEMKDLFRTTLVSLQNKGIINKSYKIPNKGEIFNPLEVEFNKNFVKSFYKSSYQLGNELFEHYPQFAIINDNYVGIRNVSKKFIDLDDAWRKYGKIIKWDPNLHSEIISLLDWATSGGAEINKSLANFICDHSWLDLKALKEEGANNTMKIL